MTSDWKPYQRRLEKEVQAMREGHYYVLDHVCTSCGWGRPGVRDGTTVDHDRCPKCHGAGYQVVVVGPVVELPKCPTCGRTLYDSGYGAYHHCPGAK